MPGSTAVGTTSSSSSSTTSSTSSAPGTTATSLPSRPPVCPIIEEINETDFGPDAALVVERYRAAGDASPEDLRPHWDALVRPFELLATIEPGDPDYLLKMLEFNELGRDPSFLAGIRAIDEFARSDCGIRAGFQLHGP